MESIVVFVIPHLILVAVIISFRDFSLNSSAILLSPVLLHAFYPNWH